MDKHSLAIPFPMSELYIALGMVFLFLPLTIIVSRLLGSREPAVRVDKQD